MQNNVNHLPKHFVSSLDIWHMGHVRFRSDVVCIHLDYF